MQILLQDLHYAARQLRKNPGLTFLVVLTLALGIGANTAIFSIVNGFVRPLPVRHPEQIVVLPARVKGDKAGLLYRHSYPALVDLRQRAGAFSDLFGYDIQLGGLTAGTKTKQLFYSAVTGNYFSALGIKPAVGRLFLPGEGENKNAETLIVLGYSCWQNRFGGDRGVVGRQVRVDGKPATIIGVVPKEFHGLQSGAEMDGYLPLSYLTHWDNRAFSDLFSSRDKRRLTVVGRLKPGITLAQAQSSVDVIARRLAEQYPASDKDIGIRVVPEPLTRPMPIPGIAVLSPILARLFLVLAALVLLVACMNVANILLVRASMRRREMAIRAALGSGRSRIVRQMLTESMLLACLGGTAGVVLALWASNAIGSMQWLESNLPISFDFSFDWRVFTYALTAALLTGIIVGVWPALRASQADVNTVLHDGGRSDTGGRQRVRSLLVMAQVAGSLTLLIAAGLFVRQLGQAQRLDLGFDANHLLNVTMDPHQVGYDRARTREFFRRLEERVRALPGVESASLAFSVPMGYWQNGSTVLVEGRTVVPGEQLPLVLSNNIDPPYFDTMRIPLLRGRNFREYDNESAPLVAIVNETMARRFWPNQDVLGKRFSRTGPAGPFIEVVGVARDSKYMVLFEGSQPYVYVPLEQDYTSLRILQVRSALAPESLITRVQREIAALDPDMPIGDVRTMRQSLAGAMGFMMFRFGATLAGVMGFLGLTLAVVGVYGVVGFAASQRTREIGIRMALGADSRDVLCLILWQGLRLVVAGVAAGLAATVALTRVMATFLTFVRATDPLTFTLVTLLLSIVGLWACYIPARRAMRLDPMAALRVE